MRTNLNINNFIKTYITRRENSLLESDFIAYKEELNEKINHKKVLVIGGAGTIGSFYIKAILKYNVAKLVVVDINENGLTELVRDLRSSGEYNIPDDFITYPVNFYDKVFEKILQSHGPFHIVANFAAHKHVRSEKDIYSIEAMIENNVLRARKLLDLLTQFPPEHFFCVSTDKAANPVNVMGASKKLMEELIISYANRLPVKTARFANVAFSNGSLLAGFIDRLNKRQPWSCPLDIRRFFISPQESGELCLFASVMGEPGDIFFPKLGEHDMISFDNIALDLLKTLNLKPDICKSENEAREKMRTIPEDASTWPVYFFHSDTSGEKSFEEFYTETETLDNDKFISLGIIKNPIKRESSEIDEIFKSLENVLKKKDISKPDIVGIFQNYLPSFYHLETGKHLDQKM